MASRRGLYQVTYEHEWSDGGHPPDGKTRLQVELRRERDQQPPLVESRSDVSIKPTTAEDRGEKIQILDLF